MDSNMHTFISFTKSKEIDTSKQKITFLFRRLLADEMTTWVLIREQMIRDAGKWRPSVSIALRVEYLGSVREGEALHCRCTLDKVSEDRRVRQPQKEQRVHNRKGQLMHKK